MEAMAEKTHSRSSSSSSRRGNSVVIGGYTWKRCGQYAPDLFKPYELSELKTSALSNSFYVCLMEGKQMANIFTYFNDKDLAETFLVESADTLVLYPY